MSASGSRRGLSKGDQRERALIEAARALLRTKPIRKITIDELAAAAGIARPGFYFYFDSKQAILAALCDEIIGEGEVDMAAWLAADGPDRAALRSGLAGSLARWRTDGLWLTEALAVPDPDREVRKIRDRIMTASWSQLRDRIERECAAGRARVADPDLAARMILTLRNSMFAQAVVSPDEYDDDRLVDAMTETTLRMIYCDHPADRAPDAQPIAPPTARPST
ncbi:TetR/AcrR family transcriptional regulator [Rhodococcus sp. D2-41]|uniref:TetR/AcrR family transcriptional regulator n=1 Tax=Speluncibacter jeojiensis TaxID=2710754 RepID=UPI00240F1ED9|nr:TetR/AcrR family transcriptional regulator [Rhodococcus sp. D2-41]MDG3009645.1 TetR/AcrR family transcriptional regulator [Rhodococcus sp. D2-41]